PVRLAPCIPGASPTIRRRASRTPKDGTGALNQSGCAVRRPSRNVTRRGQSGQSRGGMERAAPVVGAAASVAGSVFEIVVMGAGAGTLGRRAALQELRCVPRLAAGLTGFARLAVRTLCGI